MPLRVEDVDVSTERARAAVALSVLPVFLLVSTFVMGMSVAIDTTAGERERRSLEPLLLTGAPALAIGAGKWAATAVLNVAGLVLTLACAAVILTRLPLEDLGVRLESLGALSAGVLVVGVPLALLAAALQVAGRHARADLQGRPDVSVDAPVPADVHRHAVGVLARAAGGLASGDPGARPAPVACRRAARRGARRRRARGAGARRARHHRRCCCGRIASLLSSDRILYG